MQKYNKTLMAVIAAVLATLSVNYTDNVYVQVAIAIAGVFGVYVVPNKE